jgi:hypothetical protein
MRKIVNFPFADLRSDRPDSYTPYLRRVAALIDGRILAISAQGSDLRAASRAGTVATLKPSGRVPASTSSQNNGVETVAPARARVE